MPGHDSPLAGHPFTPPRCEPERSRAERRALGGYYTPPEIVRLVVELALGPLRQSDRPPQTLDPACGAGEFLLEAQRAISARFGVRSARAAVHGVDVDPLAVAAAQQRLQGIDPGFPSDRVQLGDSLERELHPAAALDAIVGNPPYINIRQLGKSWPRPRIDKLRQQFHTARGNFDLYVLFIERALELLRPGGRCGLIVPNKWATLDYARPCRELLLAETTIERVVDLSAVRPFAKAAVYPHVLVFRKELPRRSHAVLWQSFQEATAQIAVRPFPGIRQTSLSAAAISFAQPLDVESRVATAPLEDVATLNCGTAGYSAHKIAGQLCDGKASRNAAEFITTGNIDRFTIRLGAVRYLSRTYRQPSLPLDIAELTVAKRRLFRSPKIVIAGMSRRLEAAWDDLGLALGVQVFAASASEVDPFFLLALLNSKLLSYLFATRFAAKRLGGGYLAVNKGQLARLPIRRVRTTDARVQRLTRLAQSRGRVLHAGDPELAIRDDPRVANQERALDELVYDLYQLTATEVARVESHFESLPAEAA